jgi:hypothetical protein
MTEQPEPGRYNWEDDDKVEVVVEDENEKKEIITWLIKLRQLGIIH